MFKFVILFAFIAATTAAVQFAPAVATPLLGKLIPQPSLAPANTEHAGYVSGLTPVARQHVVALPAAYSGFYPAAPAAVYSAEHIPLPYASNYLAYSAPLEASHYQIAY